MALTKETVQEYLKKIGLKFFIDPMHGNIMVPCAGINGRYMFLVMLQNDGTFLQFRTMHFQTCTADSPSAFAVLKVLAEINYKVKFIKFGWDPIDGEIVAYGDVWIYDGTLTQEQFAKTFGGYISALDLNAKRIKDTIATGKDPGETTPESILMRLFKGLDEELKKMLEDANKKKEKDELNEV